MVRVYSTFILVVLELQESLSASTENVMKSPEPNGMLTIPWDLTKDFSRRLSSAEEIKFHILHQSDESISRHYKRYVNIRLTTGNSESMQVNGKSGHELVSNGVLNVTEKYSTTLDLKTTEGKYTVNFLENSGSENSRTTEVISQNLPISEVNYLNIVAPNYRDLNERSTDEQNVNSTVIIHKNNTSSISFQNVSEVSSYSSENPHVDFTLPTENPQRIFETTVSDTRHVISESNINYTYDDYGTTIYDNYLEATTPITVKNFTEHKSTYSECIDKFKFLTLKLERMNIYIQRALNMFESHYEKYFYHAINRTADDTYLEHAEECHMVEKLTEGHLEDIEHFKTHFHHCNFNANVTDSVEYFVQHFSRFSRLCHIYNETKIVSDLRHKIGLKFFVEVWPLYNRSMQNNDVFTNREFIKSFDEFVNSFNIFVDRKIELYKYMRINNFTNILNESVIVNDMQTSVIAFEMVLNNFKMEKSRMEETYGTDLNIFYTIRLPFYSIILILGLIGNCTLLIIFVLEKEIRTAANVLIFNLALSDTLNLITNIIPHLILEFNIIDPFINYGYITCRVLIGFDFLSIGLSSWTVSALSVQRYSIIFASKHAKREIGCLSLNTWSFIYLTSVWIIAIAFCLPIALNASISIRGLCTYASESGDASYRLFVYGIIPLVIVAVFYIISARNLSRSARNMPGESQGQNTHRGARFRSAKVLILLTFIFALSYIPYFMLSCLVTWNIIETTVTAKYTISIFFLLLYVNSAANPIALYVSSSTYRTYYNKYLFNCCFKNYKKPRDIQIETRTSSNPTIIASESTL